MSRSVTACRLQPYEYQAAQPDSTEGPSLHQTAMPAAGSLFKELLSCQAPANSRPAFKRQWLMQFRSHN